MRIQGVASAFPANYYPQEVLTGALRDYWMEKGMLENPQMLERLHARTEVRGRYTALPLDEYYALDTFGEYNRAWMRVAEDLGARALTKALDRAGIAKEQLGAIFAVSVTGMAAPSLDARLVNRLGLPRCIKRVPVFGLGCVAGAAGIARVADYVKAYPGQAAALVSVELCSLTIQKTDTGVANLIGSGLFGDGAAAVVMVGEDLADATAPQPRPRVAATQSTFYPDTEYVMGWDIGETGLKIVLSPDVPVVVEKFLKADAERLLATAGLRREDIGAWILHTGGPKVLEATQAALGLAPGDLEATWASLRSVGNLSSASVLCVLEDWMENRKPAPGTWAVLAAMGPGFCSELVLLRF